MFLARAFLIGLVFAVARAAAAGISTATRGDVLEALAVEVAAGTVVGLWLAFLAARVDSPGSRAVGVLATVVLVNLLAVMIEGAAFEPAAQPLSALPLDVALQLVVASAVAFATIRLVPRPPVRNRHAVLRRPAIAWLGRYLTCVIVYVVLYFVVGAINFTLVTGPYYNSGAAGLVVPAPSVVLLVALVEGALLPIALVPLLYTLSGTPTRRALIGGMSLFVLGGIVPLILAPSLPMVLRVSSAVEILFQKFPAGAAAAALLGPED